MSWVTFRKDLVLMLFLLLGSDDLFGQAKLKVAHLTGDFYVYTSYGTYEGKPVPANGMYLVTNNGVVLFDTPWDTTQFQHLLDTIRFRHGMNVVRCIATHWHSDRTEGLEYYRRLGIKTYTSKKTDALSKQNNKKRAEFLFVGDTTFQVGQYKFDTYYPGEGHTTDNIVLWFNQQRILYGGCLIKGTDAGNLGFLGDGSEAAYEATLKKLQNRYPDPSYIIVTHSNWGKGSGALTHSIEMARRLTLKSRGKNK